MRRNLPPLNALKAFEAAARCGSYVTAAQELGVSPAAVSQQVRNLEAFFGKKLFVRHNNRIMVTDAAVAIFPDTADALRQIEGMTNRLQGRLARPRLVVSALPPLAETWLPAQVGRLAGPDNSIPMEFRIEEDPVDFARHNIDLRLCYGNTLYPELATHNLALDRVTPLCAPGFLDRLGTRPQQPEGLADDDLIHTDWGPSFASHPTWRDWFRAHGWGRERDPDPAKGHRVPQSSFALRLAEQGLGICLGQKLLAQDALRDGRLIAPFQTSLPLGQPYCAVHPHAKGYKADLRHLLAGIQEGLRQAPP